MTATTQRFTLEEYLRYDDGTDTLYEVDPLQAKITVFILSEGWYDNLITIALTSLTS